MRVLCVEADPIDADQLRRRLAEWAPRIRLQCVDSVAAALALLADSDVVLLNHRPPDTALAEAIGAIRGGARTHLLLTVPDGDEAAAALAFQLGADDCLPRSACYLNELSALLNHLCDGLDTVRELGRLRERDALLALLLDSTAEAIYGMDMDGNCTFVNPSCLRVLGYDAAAEMLGKPIHQMIHHTRPDGSPYPREECPIYRAFRNNEYMHGDDEVFWRKDGTPFPVEFWSYPMLRDGQVVGAVNTFFDISQLRRSEQEREHLAHFDHLTDLPNRLLVQSRLEHAIERAKRRGYLVAVLYLDLDRFQVVNDSLGHAAGDELLVAVARRLQGRLREEDTLGRMGGDEFLVILEPVDDAQEAAVVAQDLLDELAQPFQLQAGREVYMQCSIGIGLFPLDGASTAELLREADSALFRAKSGGRNRFCFYAEEMNAEAVVNLEVEAALRRALRQDELRLHFQPKVDARTGLVESAEALVRWQREGVGLVPPGRFIPLAEKSDLIVAIGHWVIDAACRQVRAWLDAGQHDIRVAVNISARQFHAGRLDHVVADALARHRVPAQQLELEVTESMLMQHPEEAAAMLGKLKALGLKLALDDFGTGYSSLAYLARFPFDLLKIDQSFVRDLVTDPSAAIVADSIIGLAHRMGLRVIAEGVETEGQLGYLRRRGCDLIQGYYYSRPLPADEFARLLDAGRMPVPAEAGEQGTLLILDDESGILSSLRRLLRAESYRVLTAGNADEALELLAREKVQVVLSDQRMPEMSGTDFLCRVKVMYPDTVRMVLSGYADMDSVVRAINEGEIYKFLTKPWDDDRLREQLRDAFRYYEAVVKPRQG